MRENSSASSQAPARLARAERAADHRRQAARGRDQPLAVLAQKLEIDARLVVEALEVAARDQVDQVLVAGAVLRDQQQVVDRVEARLVLRALLLVEARAGRDVRLAADDRLARPPRAPSRGTRPRRTGCRGRSCRRPADRATSPASKSGVELDRAVEQRVLGVQVQMREAVFRDQANPPSDDSSASSPKTRLYSRLHNRSERRERCVRRSCPPAEEESNPDPKDMTLHANAQPGDPGARRRR